MPRTISVIFVLSVYCILPTWAQSDVPEGQSTPALTPAQRGTITSPSVGSSTHPIDAPPSPAIPPASPRSRPAASATPSFNPEPLPVIPVKEGENGHVRTVCRLGNLPANEVANILTKLLKTEGESVAEPVKTKVVIVPDAMINCLFISGPPAAVDEVRRLIGEIDRPPSMVRLEVQLIQEKEPLMQAGLCTLDNQKAYIQFGQQEPRITGATFSNSGVYNNFTHEKVGSAITITPRVGSEGKVAVLFDIQDTRLGPQEEGAIVVTPKDGPPIRTPNIESFTYQTTLQLQDGQTQTISAMTRNGKNRQIAVTAHIIRPGAANPTEQK